MSRVTELLGCKHPVIQGAMGVISNPEMVAAVSEAGGFGLLATAFAPDLETVRSQIRATRELTDRPFGANLQVMNPNTAEIAGLLAEEGVSAVTLSGGSPRALVPLLQDKGIKTWGLTVFDGFIMITVRLRQAHWAQYLLLREGLPIEHGLLDERGAHAAKIEAYGETTLPSAAPAKKGLFAWLMYQVAKLECSRVAVGEAAIFVCATE